jgi:TRAP-type uncharacterized transport system substrate-binding protein
MAKNNISTIKDLNNKKIFCGDLDSGSCFTAHFIETNYNIKFTYIQNKTKQDIIDNNLADAIISVTFAPSLDFLKLPKNYKLLDLPNNSKMNRIYKKFTITDKIYKYINKPVKSYIVLSAFVSKKQNKEQSRELLELIQKKLPYLQKNGNQAWKKVKHK